MAAMDPVPASQAPAGQISADGQFRWDGQQWVPLERSYREPTPWTRPMQLAAAALFGISVISSIITTLIFVNHDTMVKALRAQQVSLHSGTSIDDLANISAAFTYGIVVLFAALVSVPAIGHYLGWRWMFWAAMVLIRPSGVCA